MSLTAWFDIFSLALTLVAFYFLLRGWKILSLRPGVKAALSVLILVAAVHHLINFLHGSGISTFFDFYEDYTDILQPVAWGFLFYVLWQDSMASEVRTERDRARKYLDIVGVMIVAIDQNQKVTLINKKGCELLGYEEKDILGKNWFDCFIPCLERATVRKVFQDLIAEQQQSGSFGENKILTRDGEDRIIYWNNTALKDSAGRVIGSLSAGQDITEIRRIESALLTTKAHERALIDNLPHLAWVKDTKNRFILVNQAFANSCGHDIKRIIGKTDLDVWPRPLAEKYRADDNDVMRTRNKKFVEEPIDGVEGRRWFETFKSPVFDQQGNVIGTTGIARDITDRKRFEQELRDSEAKIRQVIDLVPHFVFAKNREGRFILVNQAVAKVYGTTVENLLGKTDADFNRDPAEVAHFIKDDNEVMDSGKLKEVLEEKITDSRGHARFLHTIKIPYRDTTTGKDAVLGVSTDITDRKRTQEELFKSRETLRLVLDTIPQRVFWKDRDSVYLGCNKPLAQDCGYRDPSQLIGKTDFETSSAETAELFRADDKQVMESNQAKLNYEEIQIKTDGSKGWLLTSKVPIHDKDGNVSGVLGTYEDITERKRAEEALRESEEKYRTIITAASDAIFLADSETGYIIDANRKAEELIGLPLDKIIGMHQSELHPKGEAKFYREMFRQHASTDPNRKLVGFVYNREKGMIPVQITTGWFELQGRRILMGIFRDITELKMIEEALRKDKAGLEKLVHEKSEKLGQTLKDLEDAKRLSDIGALAATVAHELRNPLGVIKTAVYNIKQKNKDNTLERHLANIDKKINESELIIKNLLSYAQIKVPLYEKVNALDTLNECIENSRHKFSAAEIDISVRHRGGRIAPIVEVDNHHLNELFSNVLDNACQAIADNKGKISADLDYNEKSGICQVAIQDNGTGIAKELLPNVFDPFFTTKSKGTGLGLSVCNQIINLYGGRIDIESVKGEGTRVILSLPIRKKVAKS